jgi:BirA family biotin operon repressor/biotin-[acetyl-CoA-carboxylase] ligase
MKNISLVMDIASLADEFARTTQNTPIKTNLLPSNMYNILHSAFAWKEKIHLYETVESTNILARETLERAIKEVPLHHHDGSLTHQGRNLHGSLFIAEQQTAGKGRNGRSFFSPQDTGLYMSLIIIPPNGVTNPAGLTAATAVAICQALEKVYSIEPSIKWVNDIFYTGKKIGGILAEAVMDSKKAYIPGAVVGIGINLMTPSQGFPSEIESIAGTIYPSTSEEKNLLKKELVVAIVTNLLQSLEFLWYQQTRPHMINEIMENYRKRCLVKPGTQIQVFPVAGSEENAYNATCLGIDHQARLHVQKEDGTQVLLNSGEVSLQSLNFTNSR